MLLSRRPSARRASAAFGLIALLTTLLALVPARPAVAVPAPAALTVTTNTWDVIGLDSNKASSSPFDTFPAGALVCNTGDVATTGAVTASFAFGTTNTNIRLASDAFGAKEGATTASQDLGVLAAGACSQAQFLVKVDKSQFQNTQKWRTNDRARTYTISASGSGLTTASTGTRTLYVQQLISQNRNSVIGITSSVAGPGSGCTATTCTFYKGQTYTVTLYAKSAPNGYDQTQAFLAFPHESFRLHSIKTHFSAPAGATADGVYGDGCGWSANRGGAVGATASCVGPPYPYTGGRVGGNPIRVVYTLSVRTDAVSTTTSSLQALIYDLSGGSYHYNADTGTQGKGKRTVVIADAADLRVTLSHTGAFLQGATGLTYDVGVFNDGPNTATSPSMTLTLPAGITLTGLAGTGWTCTVATRTCTRASLASGASAPITATVSVGTGPPAAGEVVASATVSSSTTDPKPANNTAEDRTTIAGSPDDADLVVTKTHAAARFPRGQQGTYAITVRNDGPGASGGPISVTDTLPTGLTYVSGSGTGWECPDAPDATPTCTHAALAAGASTAALAIVVDVAADAPDTVVNRASASAPANDPNPNNSTNVQDPTVVGSADLSLFKSHLGTFPIAGNGAFTFVVANAGPDAAKGPIVVTDTLPSGMSFVSDSSPEWSCAQPTGSQTVTCTRSTALASGASSSFSMVTAVASNVAAGALLNTASVTSPTSDPNPGDNVAEDLVSVQEMQDLQVTITGSASSVTAPGTITYTIKTKNNGTTATPTVTNAYWVLQIPNKSVVNETSSQSPTGTSFSTNCDAGTAGSSRSADDRSWPTEAFCSIGTLTPGQEVTSTVRIDYLAGAPTPHLMVVEASMDQVDSNPENNIASVETTITSGGNTAPTVAVTAGPQAVDEHRQTEHTYTWTAHDPDGVASVSTSCGSHGTKSGDSTATGGGTTAGDPRTGTFTCVFDDGTTAGLVTSVSVTASDVNGGSSTATRAVTVTNVVPAASISAPASVAPGASYTVSASATDVSNADTLAGFTFAFDCGSGTFGSFGSAVSTTCTADGDGPFTVRVKARDKDGGESAPDSAEVAVDAAANQAPAADDVPGQETDEDVPIEVTLTASDPDGDPVVFSIVTQPSKGSLGAVGAADCDGGVPNECTATVLYSPNPGATGADSFTYKARDVRTPDDDELDSNVATVSLTIHNVNSKPTATPVSTGTRPGTVKSITLTGTDPDGDTLTFDLSAPDPAKGSLGTPSAPDCDGEVPSTCTVTVDFTPAGGFEGVASFTYTVDDGSLVSDPATVSVTVSNTAPTATDRSHTVSKHASVEVTLRGVDADGDPLTLELDEQPAKGTLGGLGTTTCDGGVPNTCTRTVTYTPDEGSLGDDEFTYTVSDGYASAVAATVEITIVNDAPTGANQSLTTDEDTALPVTLDGEDENGDELSFAVVTGPANGSLDPTGSLGTGDCDGGTPSSCTIEVSYTPDGNWHGVDTFTYRVDDGTDESGVHTITITVTPVNDAPTAANASYTTTVGVGVVATLTGTDIDGDDTTLAIVSPPSAAQGTLGAVSAPSCGSSTPRVCTSTVTFTPAPGFTGAATFTYDATDGDLTSAAATVTITVNSTGGGGGGGGTTTTTTTSTTSTTTPTGTGPSSSVVRIAGANRMQTARLLSQIAFPDGADVVYIATAWDYADALSAGPGATSEPGPVLLTPVDSLDPDTAAELRRLAPQRIVVMGGWAAVDDTVFERLRPFAAREIVRIAGVDRFGTAAMLSREKFPGGAETVYVATGRSYPDALAGGLGASATGSPVLLTESGRLPAVTLEELERLGPSRIVIIGGSGAVGPDVEQALRGLGATVDRIAGVDRYATTAAVDEQVTAAGTDTVFVVTGLAFADALSGIPIAAMSRSAVLMVPQGDLPAAVVAELRRLRPKTIVVLGGTAAVASSIEERLEAFLDDGTGEGIRGLQISREDVANARLG